MPTMVNYIADDKIKSIYIVDLYIYIWLMINLLLVGGLVVCIFPIQLGIIIPTDELIFFQKGGSTTNQIIINHY